MLCPSNMVPTVIQRPSNVLGTTQIPAQALHSFGVVQGWSRQRRCHGDTSLSPEWPQRGLFHIINAPTALQPSDLLHTACLPLNFCILLTTFPA